MRARGGLRGVADVGPGDTGSQTPIPEDRGLAMKKFAEMRKCFVGATIVLAALSFSPVVRAQTAPVAQQTDRPGQPAEGQNENIHVDGWGRPQTSLEDAGKKPGPAPVHDLSGIWEPVPGYRDGVFASGPRDMPSDPKHEAMIPYTALGKETMNSHKAGFGVNIAPISQINDPFDTCDPIGFPRIDLFNLRALQIVQTPKQVLILYQNTGIWRNIWMDGRELPKQITEPRWFGYSVGKWTDPTTLVVTTTGLDESTWIDNTGRPHSDQLVVEETYHRVDELNIDLTVKIIDPVMYTEPWYPLKNFRLGMNSPDFDIREMICSVSQQALFNDLLKDVVPLSSDK
jgi:hypothetical protein